MKKEKTKSSGENNKKLTLRQQKFCDEYILTGNAKQSAINAGYTENYADKRIKELLGNVGCKTYISEKRRSNREYIKKKNFSHIDLLMKFAKGELREEKTILFYNKKNEIVRKMNESFTKQLDAILQISHKVDDVDNLSQYLSDYSKNKIKEQELNIKIKQEELKNKQEELRNKQELNPIKIENAELKNKVIENEIANKEEINTNGLLDAIDNGDVVD